ncbi:MAG: MFS transporter [Gammaproteobacteria bacterium]|jgi:MFS family permease
MNYIKAKRSILFGWLICSLAAIFYCYTYLLRIEPSVMLSHLMHVFKVSAGTLGFAIAFYYYAYTPLQLVVGILIDKHGARLVLTAASIVCILGSFLCASHSIYLLGVGRSLMGIGSAFSFVGVLKLAAEWLPKRHFALITGCVVSLGILSAMIGINVLTFIVHLIGWKHAMYAGTMLGIILLPIMWLVIRDTPKWRQEHAGTKTSYREVFAGLWKIITKPQMWLIGIISGILYLSLSTFAELWGISFLQRVYQITPHQAAIACSAVYTGWLIGAPLIGWFSEKIKARKILLLVGSIIAAIAATIVILKPIDLFFPLLCLMLFLFGLGTCFHILCFVISKENNPTHMAATAVSFINLLTMAGGVICQPLVGKLLDWFWDGKIRHNIHYYSAHTYQHALLFLPILMFIGAGLTLLIRKTPRRKNWDEFDVG